jgi:hypothetical protein
MAFWSDSPSWNTTGVRDAGQALITAAKDDGEGVRRHKERQQADSEARNDHFSGLYSMSPGGTTMVLPKDIFNTKAINSEMISWF